MEFYKTGKVLTLNNLDVLNLSSATYNHKAVYFILDRAGIGSELVKVRFYTNNTKSDQVTFAPIQFASDSSANTNNFTNGLLQARIAEIEYNAGGAAAKLIAVLFN
jgi:hypothetical protein